MDDGLNDIDGKKSTTVLFKFDNTKAATFNVSIKDSGSRKRKIAFEDEEMDDGKKGKKGEGSTVKPFEDSEDEYQQRNTEQERKKFLKKRKKLLKKSNAQMEPMLDELASMMDNA